MAVKQKYYIQSDEVDKRKQEADDHSQYTESDDVIRRRQDMDNHSQYTESEQVGNYRNAYNDWMNNRPGDWTGGQYGQALQDVLNRINGREKFSYDLNGDALYQQYKNQYINQGRLAMMDTLGQAATLTGGYGNSYAVTAGNQAYQGYLQGLNDKVPELYQLALDQYNREGDDLYNQFGLYQQMYGNEYGEYRDRIGDWNNQADRLYGQYTDERNYDYNQFSNDRDYYAGLYQDERNYDYGRFADDRDYYTGRYEDERNFDYTKFNDDMDRELAIYQLNHRGGSGGGGSSKDYASQKQKALELFNNGGDVDAYIASFPADVQEMLWAYVDEFGKVALDDDNDGTWQDSRGSITNPRDLILFKY